MASTFYIVDAFTDVAFAGNPAAVVLSDRELGLTTRESLARELKQPAHAFVWHPRIYESGWNGDDGAFGISWSTASGAPMEFCGHATLAASTVLLKHIFTELPSLSYTYPRRVQQRDGSVVVESTSLAVERVSDGRIKIAAKAANKPTDSFPEGERSLVVSGLQAACQIDPSSIVSLQRSLGKDLENYDLLVHLDSAVELSSLTPDFALLGKLPYHGIWMTSRYAHLPDGHNESGGPEPFRSRVFFPSYGIDEDWVCGVAHTLLAPYWATTAPEVAARTTAPGTDGGAPASFHLEAHQVSPRGGRLGIIWDGMWGEEGGACSLMGRGRVLASGKLYLP